MRRSGLLVAEDPLWETTNEYLFFHSRGRITQHTKTDAGGMEYAVSERLREPYAFAETESDVVAISEVHIELQADLGWEYARVKKNLFCVGLCCEFMIVMTEVS